ncbi:hypothetical protein, partial [Spirillospora sp. NPDC029432]|uniref:hypothetical protein n=1 Tax=Spirillospora sp. NPDC029432 TaxID=3154599 RepID=UPI003456512F
AARRDLGTGGKPPGPAAPAGGARRGPVTAARISGTRDGTAVEPFLAALRQRMGPGFRTARLGRLDGSDLTLEGRTVRLVRAVREGEDPAPTVGTVLGEGAFYLHAVDRERAGLGLTAAAVAGGAYRVQRVAPDGRREDTGMRVVTAELDTIPAGVLAYVPGGTTTLREITVRGRARPDARTVANRLETVLDGGIAHAPGSVVAITLTAQFRDLTDDEVMEVLAELERRGRLGELLNLVRVRAFRDFLRKRGVPWTYVFANWRPSPQDNAALFAGVLVGAGENFYQVLEMIGILVGSPFDEKLAQQAGAMWDGIVRLLEHPRVVAMEALRGFRRELVDTLLDLRFFDAGRLLGNAVVTAITLWEAAGALAKLGPAAVRLGTRFVRATVKAVVREGVDLAELVRTAARGIGPESQLALPGGYAMAATDRDVLLMASGGGGKPSLQVSRLEVLRAARRGELPFGGFTAAEIDELIARLERLDPEGPPPPPRPAESPGHGPAVPVFTVAVLEDLVATAIRRLRARLGSRWLPNTEFGNALHSEVSALVKERFPAAPPGLTIVTEKAVSAFGHVPARVLEMTIEEFVMQSPTLRMYRSELSSLFQGKEGARLIKNLRVDLAIVAEGETVVWDLGSVSGPDHLAKTLLYAEILRQEGHIVRVGETYWSHFAKAPGTGLRDLSPAALEAARQAREAGRRAERGPERP